MKKWKKILIRMTFIGMVAISFHMSAMAADRVVVLPMFSSSKAAELEARIAELERLLAGVSRTDYQLNFTGNTYTSGNILAGQNMVTGGHVGINFGGYSTTYALRVSGNCYTTGSWLSSDIQFKTNIEEINSPLSQLMQLRGVSYNWNKTDFPDREFNDGVQVGLIAQEVEKVFPGMVMTDENGEKAVAYYQLIPVLLEALKQQQKQIDELKQKVDAK